MIVRHQSSAKGPAAHIARTTSGQPGARSALGVRIRGVRIEKLLAIDSISRDDPLALGRNQPINELLAQFLLYSRVSLWIDEHDAILIEQPLTSIAFLHSQDPTRTFVADAPLTDAGQRQQNRGAPKLADVVRRWRPMLNQWAL